MMSNPQNSLYPVKHTKGHNLYYLYLRFSTCLTNFGNKDLIKTDGTILLNMGSAAFYPQCLVRNLATLSSPGDSMQNLASPYATLWYLKIVTMEMKGSTEAVQMLRC